MPIKLSDYVMRFVARQGVKHVFFLPGGGCMHLADSLGACAELEPVCNYHEQACAIAAEAYARATNGLGVALVTTGPGGTNTVTGVAGAWCDSTPCLFLSGQVKRADMMGDLGVRQMGPQEVDIISIVRPITKYAVTVKEPERIRYHLEKAVRLARTGHPGPVWIDIPLDVQATMLDEASLEPFNPIELGPAWDAPRLPQQVAAAIDLLNRSERPLLIAGHGIRLAGAQAEFEALIARLQLPVAAALPNGCDLLPFDHPLYAGRPGARASRGSNFALQNSDLLLALGARLDVAQTGYDHSLWARAAKKVVVNIDEAEIRKLRVPVDLPVAADVRAFLQEFLRQIERVQPRDRSDWRARCRDWKERYPVVLAEYWAREDRVSTYVLADVLSDLLTADDLVIPGSSGLAVEIFQLAFRIKPGQRFFTCSGLGAMGFGIPASVGGCLASGAKRTVTIDGDGGFQLNIQELATVARLGLPIKYFVINNEGYASIRNTQKNYFGGRLVGSDATSGLPLPDLQRVASAYGLRTARIENQANIRERVREVLETPGPVVCEVLAPPDEVLSPRMASRMRPDGTMVSSPLEDMWPFLERDEFLENMIVAPVPE